MGTSKFQAGAAKISITPVPPEGSWMSGYIYREQPSTGVHDDIYATALVLKTQEQTTAIVTLDLIGIPADMVKEIRQKIETVTDIDGSSVMFTASHTHSAPLVGIVGGCGDTDAGWLDTLKTKIVQSVEQASNNAVDATFGFDLGNLEGVAYNRHQVLKDGTVALPLQKPEDVVKQGTPDNIVRVLRVDDKDGKPIAVLTSFACHPSILDYGNLDISSDYVGYTRDYVEKEMGGIAMFATAASGNMCPVNFNVTDDVNKQYEYAKNLGQAVGKEAVRIAKNIKTTDQVKVKAVSDIIDAPLYAIPSREQVEALLEENAEILEKIKRGEMTISPSNLVFSKAGQINYQSYYVDYLKDCLEKLSSLGLEESNKVTMEIQVVMINDFVLIGTPTEPYVEIGFAIQKNVPSKKCVLLHCTNGSEGYVPNRDAHEDGGYTVERAYRFYGQLGAFAPELGEIIAETATKLIEA